MTRYVLCSDIHGDIQTAGYPRFGDVKKALNEVADYAIENKADYFICGGDVCTNDPELSLFIRMITLLQEVSFKLLNEDIPSYWLTGNHDIWKTDDCVTALDPITHGHVVKEPIYTNKMLFLPFTYYDYNIEEFCDEVRNEHGKDSVELVVGHMNIEGISPGSEIEDFPRGRNVFLPIDHIKKCFPKAIICNGHIHRRQIFKNVHIIGSLLNLTRGEIDNKPGFLDIQT